MHIKKKWGIFMDYKIKAERQSEIKLQVAHLNLRLKYKIIQRYFLILASKLYNNESFIRHV